MRTPAIATGFAVVALLGSAGAKATVPIAVPDTELRVSATAGPETESHELDAVPIGSAEVDYTVSYPDGRSYEATSHALAGGGGGSLESPPSADCEANVSATGQITGSASATAYFVHYVRVNGAPPSEVAIYNPPVFARVVYRGETTLEGDISDTSDPFLSARAVAYFTIRDGYPGPPGSTIMSEQVASSFSERTGDFSGVRVITIPAALVPYPMAVALRCDLQFSVIGGGTARGVAMADPVFEFDQQAFDEYAAFAGFPTFPLAAHYGFEYSESLVPEPGAGAQAIAAIGALALVSAGSRRRRAA